MATIKHARTIALQATSPRIVPVTLPTNVTVPNPQVIGLGTLATANTADWSTQVTGSGKPANYADVTTSILGASGTSIVMNNANLFKSGVGLAGVFIGSGGLFGKNSSGGTTFSIDGATGAATFAGALSAVTGSFGAVTVGAGGSISSGMTAYATGTGFWLDYNAGTPRFSIGNSTDYLRWNGSSLVYTGTGDIKTAATGAKARLSAILHALVVDDAGGTTTLISGSGISTAKSITSTLATGTKPLTVASTTLCNNLNAEFCNGAKIGSVGSGSGVGTYVSANKPGGNTSNDWLAITVGGTTYYLPAWT